MTEQRKERMNEQTNERTLKVIGLKGRKVKALRAEVEPQGSN
jgi:hypothetical protein